MIELSDSACYLDLSSNNSSTSTISGGMSQLDPRAYIEDIVIF